MAGYNSALEREREMWKERGAAIHDRPPREVGKTEQYLNELLKQAAAGGADVGTGILAGSGDIIDQYKKTRNIEDSEGDWEDTLKDWKKSVRNFAKAQGKPKGYVQNIVRDAGMDLVQATPYVGVPLGVLARYGENIEAQREALLEQGYSPEEVEELINRGEAVTSAGIGTALGKFESKHLDDAVDAFKGSRKADIDLKKDEEIQNMSLRDKINARNLKSKENRHKNAETLREERNQKLGEGLKNTAKHAARYEVSNLADDAQKDYYASTPEAMEEFKEKPIDTTTKKIKGLLADRYLEGA